MKNRFLSLSMAVCMICLLILTSCSAAEVPADNGGTNLGSAVLTSAAQPAAAFTDVPSDAWYAEAVQYCQGKGLMAGTSNTTFAPEATLTRAMLVTVLWRQAGKPVVNYLMQFSDVPEGQYYAIPVAWASSVGIVEGYEDATFRPESPITREQLAAILYRYARYKGLDISVRGDMGRFPDAVSVSLYAADAMSWAVGTGLIAGLDGALQPDGAAGRAQVAVILQRMCAGLLQMP